MTLIVIQAFLALIRLIEVFGERFSKKDKAAFDFSKDPRDPLK